jgi:SagB-type dehydrogenase family enzyme
LSALHHRWHAEVKSVSRMGDTIAIEVPNWRPLKIGPLAPALAEAILMLAGAGAPLVTLHAAAGRAGPDAITKIDFYLDRFHQARLIEWAVIQDNVEIALFSPLTAGFGPAKGTPPSARQVLSRFAYVRREGRALVLDSAETPCRAVLRGSAVTALGDLAETKGSQNEREAPIVEALWHMGFLESADMPEAEARACWEFADRVLHVASRGSRDATVLGGTYRFADRFTALPAEKPAMSSERTALPQPDGAAMSARSQPLFALGEARRSNRDWSTRPVPLAAISEFLWRVARVQQKIAGGQQDLMLKPIPGGGGIHELEWYLAADAIESLPVGLFHYNGFEHALYRLPESEAAVAAIRERAAISAGQAGKVPAIVIVLASRLPRLAWKYQGIAYRITLMNAGVAVEAMYLAAMDMGLAGSALGTGEQQPFERATGLSSWEETPVAEFALSLPNEAGTPE